jgi:glucose/arabinose dehydrogenase
MRLEGVYMYWRSIAARLRALSSALRGDFSLRAKHLSCGLTKPRRLRGLRIETLEARLALSTLPTGFQETLVAGGLYEPTAMVVAPDGRIFVTEKPYDVRVVENGQLLPTPFVSLSVERGGERGVDGIVLDPNFATNGFVYLYYTHLTASGSFDRLSRFTASATNPDVADPSSELVLLDDIPTAVPGFHNGGVMQFGADGMLYVGIGDTEDTTLPQDLTKLQGKILRINPAAYPNIIPSDNPFVGVPGDRPEIWASGFRNPFTGAMLPGTSQLFVNDVGSDYWEEVDKVAKGGNFGWPLAEGMSTNPAFVNPVYTYPHNGQGAAIAGGMFYTGNQLPPSYDGQYFFADYVRGFIRTLDVNTGIATDFATNVNIPVDVAMAPDGGLYWLSLGPGSGTNGGIYKIIYTTGNRQPTAVATATPGNGLAPLTVSFSGSNSTDPDGDPLIYSWDFGDGQTATGSDVTHTYTADGQYSVVLTVNDRPDGSGLLNSSLPLVITVGNQAPTATIIAPIVGSHYSAGDTISFAGLATDPEDGTLPASAYNWSIVFHHNTHTHPFIDSVPGVTSGTFQIPVIGETDPDQWYRVTLTVTDSGGLQESTYVDVLPNLSQFALGSNINGAQVTLDGQPRNLPITVTGVVGMQRTLSAPLQTINNQTYQFASWSDGGAATHTILTPSTATTYTANFQQIPYGALYSTTAPDTWLPGQTRTFTTTLTNSGTQTWNASDPSAVHLGIYFNGNSDAIYDWSSEPLRVLLPQDVAPGQTVTVTVAATAPAASGNYVFRQRLVKEGVQWFDQLQSSPIAVGTLAATYQTTAPVSWQPGQTQTFTTTVTNTGTLTWKANDVGVVHLGVYFDGNSDAIGDWATEPTRFQLSNDVAPGASATVTVTVTAPTTAGNYVLRQRLVKEQFAWFTPLQTTNVVVGNPAPTVTAVSPAAGATGVLTTAPVSATFSKAMNASTITPTNVFITKQGTTTHIAATLSYNSTTNMLTLQPSAYLATSTSYTVTIKGGATGVKDSFGNALTADMVWTFTTIATAADAAQFISQTAPASMKTGQTYAISITVKNVGTKTWDPTTFRLGSANARDNLTWGLNRVFLTSPVAPGAQVTFKFNVRAPQTRGTYNFQWQMVEENVMWFGPLSTNVKIKVT